MSVKATVRKGGAPVGPVFDIETASAEEVDAVAGQLVGDQSLTVGTGNDARVLTPVTGTGSSIAGNPSLPAPATRTGTSGFAMAQGAGISGEFDGSDLKTPQLKIVNGSGDLSKVYNQGSLIFADELLWMPPNLQPGAKNPTLIFVPVTIQKQFRENLSQEEVQEGLMPRVVNTRAEAEGMSGEGATQWINNKKPRWSPSARCLFLIGEPEHQDRQPDNLHPGFSMPFDSKNWALGLYYASGTSYGESAKVILSNACTVLRENGQTCLHKRLWTLQVIKRAAGSFNVFVPQMRLTRDATGPEAAEFIKGLLGSAV